MQIRLRARTGFAGRSAEFNFPLEFEGHRAYVIFDSVNLGKLLFKTRIEIDPKLVQKLSRGGKDYCYRGELDLPRPENN